MLLSTFKLLSLLFGFQQLESIFPIICLFVFMVIEFSKLLESDLNFISFRKFLSIIFLNIALPYFLLLYLQLHTSLFDVLHLSLNQFCFLFSIHFSLCLQSRYFLLSSSSLIQFTNLGLNIFLNPSIELQNFACIFQS